MVPVRSPPPPGLRVGLRGTGFGSDAPAACPPPPYPFEDCQEAQTRQGAGRGGGWTPVPERSAPAGIKLSEELARGISQGRGRGSEARWFEGRHQFTDSCLGDLSAVLTLDLGRVGASVEQYL